MSRWLYALSECLPAVVLPVALIAVGAVYLFGTRAFFIFHPLRALRVMLGKEKKEALFPALGWAAALPDWGGPAAGERPGGYIILLCDKTIAPQKPIDCGICGQTIQLGATEMGLGGCMLMNIKRSVIESAFAIDTERYAVEMVIALGKPAENVVLVSLPESGDVRYYRDESGTHYVPKRALDDLIVQ